MFQKFLSLLTLTTGLLLPSTLAQSCPPAQLLAPCTCDDSDLGIICDTSEGQDIDLQGMFDRITPLVGDTVVFNFLVLTYLPPSYTQLPAHLTSLKFRQIQIRANFELEYIHPEAFNGSYETTRSLIVSYNKLSNNNNNTFDNFAFFGKFPNLEWLWVTEHFLETIPSDPWPLLPNLATLILELYGLVGVGSRIMTAAALPNLAESKLRYSNMSLEGFDVDAFQELGPKVSLSLTENPISHLPEAIFKPALDSASRVDVGGWLCPTPPFCYHQTLTCDEAARWLCNNETAYRSKLFGFRCEMEDGEEEEDYDVWDWCRDNPSH